jgi:hypothetical protein
MSLITAIEQQSFPFGVTFEEAVTKANQTFTCNEDFIVNTLRAKQ